MKVEILQFCESAETRNSKLYVGGITDTFYTIALPLVVPHLKVVVRFRVSAAETGRHLFGFRLIDCDGGELLKQDGELEVGMEPHVTSAVSDMIVGLDGFSFPKAGDYEFNLYHNGSQVGSTPLYVVLGERS